MNIFKTLIFTLFILTSANAQRLDSLWEFNKHDRTLMMSRQGDAMFDADSNMYVCVYMDYYPGHYVDVDFGPGVVPAYGKGVEIIKYDRNFNFIWLKSIHGDLNMFISSFNNDKIYLTGDFEDTVDFNPDPLVSAKRISRYKESFFMLELDTSGNFQRVVVLEGLKSGVFFRNYMKLGVHHNADKSFYIYSVLEDSLDIDPGPGKIAIGGNDMTVGEVYVTAFLLHLDSNLKYLSHIAIPNGVPNGFLESFRFHISIINGKIVFSGQQKAPIYPSRQHPGLAIPFDSHKSFVLIEYDSNLNYLGYKKPFWCNRNMHTNPLVRASNGEIYALGSFMDSLVLDSSGFKKVLRSKGMDFDAVIIRFNDLESLVPTALYHVGTVHGELAFFNGFIGNHLIATVHMWSPSALGHSPDFDPGPDTVLVDKSPTYGTALVRLDKDLNFRWAGSFVHSDHFYRHPLMPINDTTLFLFGSISSDANVDVDLSWNKRKFYGYKTANRPFFAKYHFPKPIEYNYDQTICEGDSFKLRYNYLKQAGQYSASFLKDNSGDSVVLLNLLVNPSYLIQSADTFCHKEIHSWRNKDISSTGIYYDSLKTSLGCDSVFRKNVFFRKINTTITLFHHNFLEAVPGYTRYSWVECYPHFSQISTGTDEFYLAPKSGLYGVIINDQYGCSDTSACIQIQGVGINSTLQTSISVYPNPFDKAVHIEGLQAGDQVRIYSGIGSLIHSSACESDPVSLDLPGLAPGFYTVEVIQGENTFRMKIVKK